MNDSNNTLLDSNAALSPRFETAGPLLIAGLREPLDERAAQKIPQLWQRLVACWDEIPQRVGITDYGLCIHLQGHEYYYMAGCAVWDFTGLPEIFSPFIIPSQTYAVFTHEGHVNHIRDTIGFAFDQWLPNSNYRHATAPENALHFFERYGEKFDPKIGEGDVEIWLPVISH
jgi:AraC family transcriptional regulator